MSAVLKYIMATGRWYSGEVKFEFALQAFLISIK